MENGQQAGVSSGLQPLMTTPTVERLLPIGTIARTGRQSVLLTYIMSMHHPKLELEVYRRYLLNLNLNVKIILSNVKIHEE